VEGGGPAAGRAGKGSAPRRSCSYRRRDCGAASLSPFAAGETAAFVLSTAAMEPWTWETEGIRGPLTSRESPVRPCLLLVFQWGLVGIIL
jgi:hypothetical protein